MKLFLRIFGYLRPHAGLFGASIVFMTVFSVLDALSFTMLIPFLNVLFSGTDGGVIASSEILRVGDGWVQEVMDGVVGWFVQGGTPMQALRDVVLLLFFIFLVKNVALYVQAYTTAVVEGRVTRDLRDDIYAHLLQLGFPYFQRTRTGQLISRVTVDVDQMRMLVTGNVSKLLSSVAETLAYLLFLLGISWKLTLVALLALPPMLLLWARLRKRLRKGVLRVLDAVGEVASQVQETVGGIRLVKASGAEEWEERRFRSLTQSHYKATIRNERWRKFFPPATEMITAVAILGLIWYGSYLVLEERSLDASAFLTVLVMAG
jgi:ABC-type multidrug transport system fused ATPase/permease subunit